MTTLYQLGEAVLARIVAEANLNGVTLPNRQIVYPSPIPADCEQVAVLLSQWAPEPGPESGFMPCVNFRWAASLAAIITRCTPAKLNTKGRGTQFPDVSAMNEVAQIASTDAEILLGAVMSFDEISNDVSVAVAPPEGGFQTVELTFRLPGTMIV